MNHPFTPEYIAMAKAAEEIQAMRPPFEPGDAVLVKKWDQVVYVGSVHYDETDGIWTSTGTPEEEGLPSLWVPRLDQLLGMLPGAGIPDNFLDSLGLSGATNDRSLSMKRVYSGICDWHELALAVVMREKHGKTWRDGKWVKLE